MLLCVVLFVGTCCAACGDSWTNQLVPETKVEGVDFTPACVRHDECYNSCGAEKNDCDRVFHLEIRRFCREAFIIVDPKSKAKRHSCLDVVNTYNSAIRRDGDNIFQKAQDTACHRA